MQAEFTTAFASYGGPRKPGPVWTAVPGGLRADAMSKPSKGEDRSRKCW